MTPLSTKVENSTHHLFVIRSRSRDVLADHLRRRGNGVGIHYPYPVHLQPAASKLGYRRGDFPVAKLLSDEILSLPMYPEMTDEEVAAVVSAIRDFYDPKARG